MLLGFQMCSKRRLGGVRVLADLTRMSVRRYVSLAAYLIVRSCRCGNASHLILMSLRVIMVLQPLSVWAY